MVYLLLFTLVSQVFATDVDDGIMARKNQFPAVVKLEDYQVKRTTKVSRDLICSGTLLTPTIVLTAAHCASKEPNTVIKVSNAGDALGATSAKSIEVAQQFVASGYRKSALELSEFRSRLNSFAGAPGEFQAMLQELIRLNYRISESDLAFMILDRPQKILKRNLPELACENLALDEEVEFAGYGVINRAKHGDEDFNDDSALAYGANRLEAPEREFDLYMIQKREHQQMVNSGDSGGPLFRAGSQKRVFGVISQKLNDFETRENARNLFAPTSMRGARVFYQELLENRLVPAELKALLRKCLK